MPDIESKEYEEAYNKILKLLRESDDDDAKKVYYKILYLLSKSDDDTKKVYYRILDLLSKSDHVIINGVVYVEVNDEETLELNVASWNCQKQCKKNEIYIKDESGKTVEQTVINNQLGIPREINELFDERVNLQENILQNRKEDIIYLQEVENIWTKKKIGSTSKAEKLKFIKATCVIKKGDKTYMMHAPSSSGYKDIKDKSNGLIEVKKLKKQHTDYEALYQEYDEQYTDYEVLYQKYDKQYTDFIIRYLDTKKQEYNKYKNQIDKINESIDKENNFKKKNTYKLPDFDKIKTQFTEFATIQRKVQNEETKEYGYETYHVPKYFLEREQQKALYTEDEHQKYIGNNPRYNNRFSQERKDLANNFNKLYDDFFDYIYKDEQLRYIKNFVKNTFKDTVSDTLDNKSHNPHQLSIVNNNKNLILQTAECIKYDDTGSKVMTATFTDSSNDNEFKFANVHLALGKNPEKIGKNFKMPEENERIIDDLIKDGYIIGGDFNSIVDSEKYQCIPNMGQYTVLGYTDNPNNPNPEKVGKKVASGNADNFIVPKNYRFEYDKNMDVLDEDGNIVKLSTFRDKTNNKERINNNERKDQYAKKNNAEYENKIDNVLKQNKIDNVPKQNDIKINYINSGADNKNIPKEIKEDLQKHRDALSGNETYGKDKLTNHEGILYDINNNDTKKEHWMWYAFPQFVNKSDKHYENLSDISKKFALTSKDHIDAYLNDRELSTKLSERFKVLSAKKNIIKFLNNFSDLRKLVNSIESFKERCKENDEITSAIVEIEKKLRNELLDILSKETGFLGNDVLSIQSNLYGSVNLKIENGDFSLSKKTQQVDSKHVEEEIKKDKCNLATLVDGIYAVQRKILLNKINEKIKYIKPNTIIPSKNKDITFHVHEDSEGTKKFYITSKGKENENIDVNTCHLKYLYQGIDALKEWNKQCDEVKEEERLKKEEKEKEKLKNEENLIVKEKEEKKLSTKEMCIVDDSNNLEELKKDTFKLIFTLLKIQLENRMDAVKTNTKLTTVEQNNLIKNYQDLIDNRNNEVYNIFLTACIQNGYSRHGENVIVPEPNIAQKFLSAEFQRLSSSEYRGEVILCNSLKCKNTELNLYSLNKNDKNAKFKNNIQVDGTGFATKYYATLFKGDGDKINTDAMMKSINKKWQAYDKAALPKFC